MEIKIEILPCYSIIYIRKVGPYGVSNIEIMEKLKSFLRNVNLLNDESVILGISQDNPENTTPEKCRYDACLVISDDMEITNEDIKRGEIVGGKYAVFTIEHTVEAVQKAWNEIFYVLLSKGYEIDTSKPIIERYINNMVKNHKCEICIPIK